MAVLSLLSSWCTWWTTSSDPPEPLPSLSPFHFAGGESPWDWGGVRPPSLRPAGYCPAGFKLPASAALALSFPSLSPACLGADHGALVSTAVPGSGRLGCPPVLTSRAGPSAADSLSSSPPLDCPRYRPWRARFDSCARLRSLLALPVLIRPRCSPRWRRWTASLLAHAPRGSPHRGGVQCGGALPNLGGCWALALVPSLAV